MFLKGLYILLLFSSVAAGISTFYIEARYVTPPSCITPGIPGSNISSPELCQKAQESQQKAHDLYIQNVSIIALAGAIIYFVIGFIIFANEQIFSYGFLLGSLFTLLYSLLRGLSSTNSIYTFVIIFVSLGIVIYTGYYRFLKQNKI